MSEIKDFSRPRKPVVFTVDGDTFEAAPAIPAETLAEFGDRYQSVNEADTIRDTFQILASVFELVLLPNSHALILARLKDRSNPIDIDQLTEIIEWLMEQYGLRPTRSSPDSSNGQPPQEPGTSSTDAAPAEESTSPPFLPIAS